MTFIGNERLKLNMSGTRMRPIREHMYNLNDVNEYIK